MDWKEETSTGGLLSIRGIDLKYRIVFMRQSKLAPCFRNRSETGRKLALFAKGKLFVYHSHNVTDFTVKNMDNRRQTNGIGNQIN